MLDVLDLVLGTDLSNKPSATSRRTRTNQAEFVLQMLELVKFVNSLKDEIKSLREDNTNLRAIIDVLNERKSNDQ